MIIIKDMIEGYFKNNILPDGCTIENWKEVNLNDVKTIGSFELTDGANNVYLVEYESLVSLHGTGVDDLYTVTKVTPV